MVYFFLTLAGLSANLQTILESSSKSAKKKAVAHESIETVEAQEKTTPGSVKIFLNFKRFMFDDKRKMIQ